tara:strand:+ start:1508 stop:1996 length:489 start_codon:yes stop_codon:yes gene_type:complete
LFAQTLDMFAKNTYIKFMNKIASNQNVFTNNYNVCEKVISNKYFNNSLGLKGYELIPAFDGSAKLNTLQTRFLPNYSVVYFFHDLRGIYYIGETKSLSCRFEQHLFKKENKLLVQLISNPIHEGFISWVRCVSYEERTNLEKKLVKVFNPIANTILFKRSKI